MELKQEGKPDFAEKIICTGTYLYKFEPPQKEIRAYELPRPTPGQVADNNFMSFMFGMKAEEAKKRYTLTLAKEDKWYIYVDVAPRFAADKNEFARARLVLNRDSFLPRQLWFEHANGNEITWDIPQLRSGVSIDRRSFDAPKPPPGWKLVPVNRATSGGFHPPERRSAEELIVWKGRRNQETIKEGEPRARPFSLTGLKYQLTRNSDLRMGLLPLSRFFTTRSRVMRRFWLTLALIGLLALPVLAQRGGFGFGFGGPQTGDMLLMAKAVQKELKFDDKQLKQIANIESAAKEYRDKGMESFKDGDKEEAMKMFGKAQEETAKGIAKFKESLTSEQKKRFHEIEIQVAAERTDAKIFGHSGIQKALKLTSKQQEAIKETLSDLDKDIKEVQEDAKGDKQKMFGTFKKIQGLNKDAYEKITKGLTEEQAKAWKELGGEKFDTKELFKGFGKGGKGGKGGKKKKNDDF